MDPGPGSLPWVQQFWAWGTIITAPLLGTLPLLSSGTDPRPLAIGWPCDPRWATVIGPGIATDSEPSQSEPFSGLPLVEGPPSWWSGPERQRPQHYRASRGSGSHSGRSRSVGGGEPESRRFLHTLDPVVSEPASSLPSRLGSIPTGLRCWMTEAQAKPKGRGEGSLESQF